MADQKAERTSAAFKCNYCDGGQRTGHAGFCGVCSDSMIRYNIKVKKCRWCAYEDSPCRRYWDGKMSRTELESMMQRGKTSGKIVCYESRMLLDWKAYAGVNRSGECKGKPRRFQSLRHNGLAVLTTREPEDSGEAARFIFAAFLIDELYKGDDQRSDYVTADARWKIELAPEQSHKIRFWDYHSNQSNPGKLLWGSGLYRYLSDEQAAQILRDIAEVKRGTEEEKFARQFLEHYCAIHGIDAEAVPPPGGALRKTGLK